MAFSPITSWQIDGGNVETGSDFIFLGSKITAGDDCSHKIKTHALCKNSYDKPRQCIKNRDTILPTKVCIVKAVVFPVVKYGCEIWTIKKAKCQNIDAFQLQCWRRFLRVPWAARR